MNRTGKTRKQAVLDALRAAKRDGDGWVDGPALANPAVGGSEGLKRLRELRQDGYDIKVRRHPDAGRAVFQYRLTSETLRVPEVDIPYVSWSAHRGGFKALLNGAHLQVFCNLDRTRWYWTSKGTVKGSGGPDTLDAMKRAAVLAVLSHR